MIDRCMYADVRQTHLAVQDFNTHQTPALQCVYTASVSLRSRNMVNNQSHREKD